MILSLSEAKHQANFLMNIDYDLSNTIEVLAYSIDILVNDPNIKHVLERRYESDFYFVKEAKRILRDNYVPSMDDILYIYEPTHGTHEIVVKVTKDHLSTGTDVIISLDMIVLVS